MVEVVAIIACAVIIIVSLTYSKDLLKDKRRTRIKAIEKESIRMQTDISELNIECRQLRKKVAELQEQIAELYIEHHNKP